MKKKLLSVVLCICLTVGVAVPAAAEDAVTIVDNNVTVSEDINTDAQVGAQATSTSADAGITAENITVNNEGGGQAGGNVAGEGVPRSPLRISLLMHRMLAMLQVPRLWPESRMVLRPLYMRMTSR